MSDSSERISELFTVGSRDVTPAPARHAARVLYAPISRDAEVSRHCASVLSDAELQRRDRLDAECDKARFEQRRAFRRFCGATALGLSQPLSEIVFEETENGRPYLSESPDLWFSFSSCQSGLLGAWSSTHAIGVDLEDQTRDLEARELARQYFSVAEAEAVEAVSGQQCLRTFYQFWSLKEAALKSIGEGLPYGLEAFEFELAPRLHVVHAPPDHGGPERFSAYAIVGTDSCAALVIRTPQNVQPK
ncbi:4'-phosphopantetheinyl transferase psf-1 [Symmachiella macrocystis]|uniref:4'-phosphopantetheinyl transferase psf-1 n=1 Tax=Symmachiella macrocystis TaxID=2527985 RepID=A0A5C6AVE9_9PLAN|nr:4'-phosphopantetheinyl transferase superfamily protein [Symmachiella macrocystis]TWU03026.1 4'-phosphopantetheinyl transferase psf-1 [Symmachiella macrocystis]